MLRHDLAELPVRDRRGVVDGRSDRIIQDPESLRATSQRNGAAWESWSRLKKNVAIQMNSSDHNPAVLPGMSPKTSPELDTPWFKQYLVTGGANNDECVGKGCEQGYILSNANWDPVSMDNDIEALSIAVANHGHGEQPADPAVHEHVLHGHRPRRHLRGRRALGHRGGARGAARGGLHDSRT